MLEAFASIGSLVSGLLRLPMGVLLHLWALVKAAAGLPASVTRHYLGLLLSAVLYIFVKVLRIQPHGYIKVGKVVELQKVIDHLYAQVELYRGVVRELKDDMEAKESDRRMAIKRLKSTKEEIKLLNEKLYQVQDGEHGDLGSPGGGLPRGGVHEDLVARGYFVSISFLVCVLAVVMFHAYVPGGSVLEWKVVMSVGFPIVWMYLGSLSGSDADHASSVNDGGTTGVGGMRGIGAAGSTLRSSVLLSSMWWLVGFLGGVCVARLD